MIMMYLSISILLVVVIPVAYLTLLMLASFRNKPKAKLKQEVQYHRFAIAIPAHNEASVIESTVRNLCDLNYPQDFFSIYVVADHCSDDTVSKASHGDIQVYERRDCLRSGKGAALSWLFAQILEDDLYDAVVIFDADTRVDPSFLKAINNRLIEGRQAVQGQHIISNPDDGWYPLLMWAMFLVDNRYQNLGRTNLGWSAKNMGDSICIRADILRQIGWGRGLTEDYQLRQKLLIHGIKIVYEPTAVGYGEAARSWGQARAQRARWLRGTTDSSQLFRRQLLVESIRRHDISLLDGAMQAYLPSYSTLTIVAIAALGTQLLGNWWIGSTIPPMVLYSWLVVIGLLFVYPFIALILEKAPFKAFLAILSGPLFIVWRTWLALRVRFRRRPVKWVRTAHGK